MIKLNTEFFIKMANELHNNIYDYSLVEYVRSSKKVIIICKKHGQFLQTPNKHLMKRRCPKCFGRIKLTLEEFIKKSNIIHNNKYDYSNSVFLNVKSKISIGCKEHGIFLQRGSAHLDGYGCPICSNNVLKTIDFFISKSNGVHNGRYNYSKSIYLNDRKKLIIICKLHGEFLQSPNKHYRRQGCPNCQNSIGENIILDFLNNNNINYIKEYKFNSCVYRRKLSFDFYLPDHNICIEYDGIQHFKPIDYFGGESELLLNKRRDNIKNKFCLKNNIKLIRFDYLNKKEEIDKSLSNLLF